MLQPSTRFLVLATAVLVGSHLLSAEEAPTATLVRSDAPDWPQWRGPHRNGICEEKGLLGAWPDDGPNQEWTVSGIGGGYASPIVVNNTIYIPGDGDEDLLISAVSLGGKLRWQTKNGAVWTRPVPGARTACCYDDGKLYHMNAHGRLACLDAANGAELWAVNVLERFEGKNITWGISESVLVDGDLVFVTPAGAKALMAALDKKTGETVWTAEPLAGEQASYSSPVLLDVGEKRLLVNSGAQHAFAVDAGSGKVSWCIRHLDPGRTITTTPVLTSSGIVFTNASRSFGGVFCVGSSGQIGERLWSSELKISHGGAVCVADSVFGGSGGGAVKGWAKIDTATGTASVLDNRPVGSLIYADNRFYCLTERGTMTLEKLDGGGFTETGSFQLAEGKDVWAHPVICKGRLLLRYHDTLYCYGIRR
ncbi:MAG: PQQ-binding-like beta-propeller repeat protein [Planctomycetes bacterium]|nr:PQQ-binding-like beta-propeller repeat protein [Planctomycetota bacterium]